MEIRTSHLPSDADGREWVVLQVRDTGTGVLPEHLDSIFAPFFTTKPPGKGTGLGLSITKSIVDDHGGKIEVSSTPGKGTVVRVALPARSPG